MFAKREIWNYNQPVGVWVGKYRNSHNLLHWHFDCEFLYTENGSIDVFCEGKTHTLSAGEALFVDSGEVHHMKARQADTVLIVIIFDYDIIKPYLGGTRLKSPRLAERYPVPEIYKRIREALLSKRPFCGAEAALEILGLMLNVFQREELKTRKDEESIKSLKMLLEDVNAHYETYTFEDAVSFMNMSPAYFSRFFHGSTGITFSQYLSFVRTDNAVRLLRLGEYSATEISERCGFGTVRTFNRVFKELTGFSPRTLPKDFVLNERFSYPSDEFFEPTLYDCELIESGE